MSESSVIDRLLGPSIEVLNEWPKLNNKNIFFKPISSFSDIAFRTASIVCAPVIMAGLSLLFLTITAACMLNTIYKLFRFDLKGVKCGANEAWMNIKHLVPALLINVLSPIINAIDLMGGIVSSVIGLFHHKEGVKPISSLDERDEVTSAPTTV